MRGLRNLTLLVVAMFAFRNGYILTRAIRIRRDF